MSEQEPIDQQNDAEGHGRRIPRKLPTPTEGVQEPRDETDVDRPGKEPARPRGIR